MSLQKFERIALFQLNAKSAELLNGAGEADKDNKYLVWRQRKQGISMLVAWVAVRPEALSRRRLCQPALRLTDAACGSAMRQGP